MSREKKKKFPQNEDHSPSTISALITFRVAMSCYFRRAEAKITF